MCQHSIHYLLAWLVLLASACATTWQSRPLVDPRLVARALGDKSVLSREEFHPESVPVLKPPTAVRPCCAFGMDLRAKLGAMPIPGYKNGNILGPEEVGPHGYDKSPLVSENNGLVYTCRGGFIDVAHIRDNADRTLYLTMELARHLPAGFTLELPEEGTRRRVIVKPMPADLLSHYDRWTVATTLAQWVNYQLSIWHEIASWYGWESIKGFSERVSAFSPEDMYSNVLGQNLAAGIVLNQESDSRDTYDRAMDAWIREALRRLHAVSRVDGRRAMQAIDGLWWDSKRSLPEFKLVIRRNFDIAPPIRAWFVEDALPKGPVQAELKEMCAKSPPPLPLAVADRIGEHRIEDLLTLEFVFSSWLPESFPIAARKDNSFTLTEFPAILKDIHAQGEKDFGPGFDQPRPERSHP